MRWMGLILVVSFGCSAGNGGTDNTTGTDQTGYVETVQPETGAIDVAEDDTVTTNQMALYESGSRIRARVGMTPDGAKMFLGWYDTELGINCRFRKLDGPVARCYPLVGEVALFNNLFLDSSCTKPIGYFGDQLFNCGIPMPKYATGSSAFLNPDYSYDNPDFKCTEPMTVEVYEVDAQIESTTVYYKPSQGGEPVCSKFPESIDPSGLYSLGSLISLEEFQSMEESVE